MPTYDEMDGVSLDRFYTFDDPLGNVVQDTEFAKGTVTRSGPSLGVDWGGSGTVVDNLNPPFTQDNFGRVVAGGWGTSEWGQTYSISNAPNSSVDGSYGHILNASVNTTNLARIDNVLTADFDMAWKFRLTPNGLYIAGGPANALLLARYVDSNNWLRLAVELWPSREIQVRIQQLVGGSFLPNLFDGMSLTCNYDLNAWYWARFQGVGTMLRAKVWQDGQQQPDDWHASGLDVTTPTTAGQMAYGFYLGSGVTSTLPISWDIDKVWTGLNAPLAVGQVAVTKSLDDGMPQGITDTSNLGVAETSAQVLSDVGTDPTIVFSQFRSDQANYDVDRDVPGVAIGSDIVTANGLSSRRIFTGQMSDLSIGDDSVTLKAVSRSRLKLAAPIQPPPVHGFYEGCEATWLIGYAHWKSGLWNAPPLTNGTRLYMPMNGSLHSYWPDTKYTRFQAGVVKYSSASVSAYDRPSFVDGPFPGTAAPDVAINGIKTWKVASTAGEIQLGPGYDFMSQSGFRGRMECWVRGDATDIATSFQTSEFFLVQIEIQNAGHTRYVQLNVPSDNRRPYGILVDGVAGTKITLTDRPLPTDGLWHHIGVSWDLDHGLFVSTIDGVTIVNGLSLNITDQPLTDDTFQVNIKSWLPIAEFRMGAGPNQGCPKGLFSSAVGVPWARDLPYTVDVNMRRSLLTLDGVGEVAPREAFAVIQDIALSELAQVGFDENDVFQYLPITYFGENQNNIVREALSTSVNLGRDFKPVRDVNNIYNQVVVTYKQQKVNENFTVAANTSQLITIPNGYSYLDIATNNPLIEMRSPTSPLSVLSGSALAAAPPSESNAINYITANTAIDGTGTYMTSSDLIVTIIGWTPGVVSLQFYSKYAGTLYVANNVNLAPFGLAGKMMIATDAAVIAQSDTSIAYRGTRSIGVSLPNVHKAADALMIARELVARLAYPRATFTTSAFGDVRRSPGQLVSVADPDRTNLMGNFRLTGVQITQVGEDVQQKLSGREAMPFLVWGVTEWGNTIWGEAV
jgi:hypothetical protein